MSRARLQAWLLRLCSGFTGLLRAWPCEQVSNAAMMSMTGRMMSEKIDVLRLTFYTAPVSCALLLPVFFIREARPLLADSCSGMPPTRVGARI